MPFKFIALQKVYFKPVPIRPSLCIDYIYKHFMFGIFFGNYLKFSHQIVYMDYI